ncbi:hypothetical protein IscW_ISCW000517 [Ixodes scapularis]|uniref:Uncharacterized protein n=1 Tax=Ixodes scapularis TaxID=6945 RepID=B7P7B4_IXOSC|nr:hypothetical protein IscW_ISCW000517 [Ixodes scapularis]|eukprot:XP_002409981.1 hypothetical protein IscW_ISCW000517 [Ixodes scapularis]
MSREPINALDHTGTQLRGTVKHQPRQLAKVPIVLGHGVNRDRPEPFRFWRYVRSNVPKEQVERRVVFPAVVALGVKYLGVALGNPEVVRNAMHKFGMYAQEPLSRENSSVPVPQVRSVFAVGLVAELQVAGILVSHEDLITHVRSRRPAYRHFVAAVRI